MKNNFEWMENNNQMNSKYNNIISRNDYKEMV